MTVLYGEVDTAFLTGPLRLMPATQAGPQTCTVDAFLDRDYCAEMLDWLGPVIGSPRRRITASLLAKRWAFLLTGAGLYALSACDRGLDVSRDNCLLDLSHDGQCWVSSLLLHDTALYDWPDQARPSAREQLVHRLFAGVMQPLWQVLTEVSGVPPRMLWENTAVRVYSLYERRMKTLPSARAQARRDADFEFLLSASPAVFGLPYNPLAYFLGERTPLEAGGSVRFRKTCCLYFKATCPPEYCAACPLLKPRRDRHGL
ncbi:IucA/IucC family C-terminal-domain containing protein [Larsenimonas rhizosphaerae]|uniref:Siderophore-iron reductase, Fe-S cluster protein n=1 Tax=Larsenimonas rhizosphaerae TaxID=2944682 RepID=A0AA42CY70_9GAMM|nr:IucA/IucC family C-terminal-domain containing protein [Larsenimonas rhizosphaerae]MCX2524765.1 siderophore-iron reductase, Fe-S cluster protein [Larsenimonas rhizosphaerae]